MEKLYLFLIAGLLMVVGFTNNIHAAREYLGKDPEECKIMLFQCPRGQRIFFDAIGCGCEHDPNSILPEKPVFCTEEYAPVCGWTQVQCITSPCNPVPETFSNRCHALRAGATRIEEGPCTP